MKEELKQCFHCCQHPDLNYCEFARVPYLVICHKCNNKTRAHYTVIDAVNEWNYFVYFKEQRD